ncbi:class I tRNA ligase family protein, partial [Candidatus Kaiserbacteria bacterium]|nr:class I tRNA ligase family protein [Candidatus Kaiserbacteria bacterium]
ILGALSILENQTIKKVGESIEEMKFNTGVAALMIFSNELQKLEKAPRKTYETLLRLLAPFAPHLIEELWEKLGHKTSIHLEIWPAFDHSKLEEDTVTIAVQIGGKTRGTVTVPRGASEAEVLGAARRERRLAELIPKEPRRVVFVPNKIINIVP